MTRLSTHKLPTSDLAACNFGLIGLAVMGENLALNVESRGYRVAVYNRTVSKVDEFMAGRAAGKRFVGCHTLEDLVAALKPPRKVMLMVKAGPAVDDLIEALMPLLAPGDILIDGGNTYYADTERRTKSVEQAGLLYVGTGVSGGKRGAARSQHDAWRQPRSVADPETHLPGDCRQSGSSKTTFRAASGSARAEQATTSRWCTTGSNMATCN